MITEVLEYVAKWNDSNSSVKAAILLKSLLCIDFIVSLILTSFFFSLPLPMSRLFEKETIYILQTPACVENLLPALKKKKADPEREFSTIWKKSRKLADALGINVEVRRL